MNILYELKNTHLYFVLNSRLSFTIVLMKNWELLQNYSETLFAISSMKDHFFSQLDVEALLHIAEIFRALFTIV